MKANDQAGLTFQAVNVEQTVSGKTSPNDRPSQQKEQRRSSPKKSVHVGIVMFGICLEDFLDTFVPHPHSDWRPLVLKAAPPCLLVKPQIR